MERVPLESLQALYLWCQACPCCDHTALICSQIKLLRIDEVAQIVSLPDHSAKIPHKVILHLLSALIQLPTLIVAVAFLLVSLAYTFLSVSHFSI